MSDGPVSDAAEITDNEAGSRLEIRAGDRLAGLAYRRNGRRLVLIHTEVPPELEGRGIGGALVSAVIDRAAQDGMTIVPLCPFARSWLQRHPDSASRVTVDWGAGSAP